MGHVTLCCFNAISPCHHVSPWAHMPVGCRGSGGSSEPPVSQIIFKIHAVFGKFTKFLSKFSHFWTFSRKCEPPVRNLAFLNPWVAFFESRPDMAGPAKPRPKLGRSLASHGFLFSCFSKLGQGLAGAWPELFWPESGRGLQPRPSSGQSLAKDDCLYKSSPENL